MIADTRVKEAERLLAEGKLSHRKIARTVGISRATVGAIASGKRPDYEARRLARAAEEEPLGPIERCAGCGAMVHMPCRACRVQRAKQFQQDLARAARKAARERATRRLLEAVRKASQERDARANGAAPHFPAAAAPGASDCK